MNSSTHQPILNFNTQLCIKTKCSSLSPEQQQPYLSPIIKWWGTNSWQLTTFGVIRWRQRPATGCVWCFGRLVLQSFWWGWWLKADVTRPVHNLIPIKQSTLTAALLVSGGATLWQLTLCYCIFSPMVWHPIIISTLCNWYCKIVQFWN